MFTIVRTQLLVSIITPYLEVDYLGSTLIMDTSIGEIVLFNKVCRGYELVIANRNLMDDSYTNYYTWYVIYRHGISCEFDAFNV